MTGFWQDLRYAVRQLRKSPGFTTIAVLTLALGIGANTAIFSLIDAVLLRSLPVSDPQRLVTFQWTAHNQPKTTGYYGYMSCAPTSAMTASHRTVESPDIKDEQGCSFSYPMFQQFESLGDLFSGVAALGGHIGLNLRENGTSSFVHGEMVSGAFFETVGVGVALGRPLNPTDDKPGAPPVAELGYEYWQSQFGSDPTLIGKTIWLNNVPVTVVGVVAKTFSSLNPARTSQVWLPLSLEPQLGQALYGNIGGDHPSLQSGEDNWWVYLVGRLKPGIRLEQAESAADTVFRHNVIGQSKTLFKPEDAPRLKLVPAPQGITGLRDRFSKPLTVLMIAVGIVLLIVCSNVAGLTLARSATRQGELALRIALGAGRGRIVRQLLTESVLLSMVGGGSGVLLGYWGVRSLVAFMSREGYWPSHLSVQLDPRILSFTALVSVFAGLLFGLAPAFRGMRVDLTAAIKQTPTPSGSGMVRGGSLNLGSGLVIVQVALTVLVLAGAGLLVRTLENLKKINPGFDTQNVLLFRIDPTLNGYTEARTLGLYSELQQRLGTLPGVRSVSYSYDPLLSGNLWTTSFRIEGETHNAGNVAQGLAVGPKFFETLGIPLLAGRALTLQDFSSVLNTKLYPILISKEFERHFFKNQNPLGRRISGLGEKGVSYEIVGVVGDAKYQGLRSEISPTIYIPQTGDSTTFELRLAADSTMIIPEVRSVVSQLDNNLPMLDIQTQSEMIDRSLFQERIIARLSSFFGGLSLLLGCIGLYGLLSYEVNRRTREIGVRMALGAQPGDVMRIVVGQGIRLVFGGILIGLIGSLLLGRFLLSFLYGVKPTDPLTLGAVVSLLLGIAVVACYIPARRAAKVDPMVALRYE